MKRLITGAPIYTMDPGFGVVEAMVADQGRIIAVGDRKTLGRDHPGARETDVSGGAVIPAFNDSHAHLFLLGQDLTRCNLAGCRTRVRVIDALSRWRDTLSPGAWLMAWNFDAANYQGERPLACPDLDPVFPGIPVVISDRTKHALMLNSAAMERCGIGAATPDPKGGIVERDSQGSPLGIFREMSAMALVESAMPAPDRDEVARCLGAAMAYLVDKGILAATEAYAGNWHPLAEKLAAYNRVLENGGPVRVTLLPDFTAADRAGWIESGPDRQPSCHPDVRIGPLKLMADGAISAKTAALSSPYESSGPTKGRKGSGPKGSGPGGPGAGEPENRGHLALSPDELNARVLRAQRAGWATATHAIGDHAIRIALEAIEAAGRACPRPGLHHRIEHAILLDPALIPRLAAAGIRIGAQPQLLLEMGDNHHAAVGSRSLGEKPYLSLLRAGVPVGFGSDLPVVDGDPILGWRAAVNRLTRSGRELGAREALGPLEALACYTRGSALIGGDREIGSLTPGKQARFAVLSHRPEQIMEEEITVTGVSTKLLDT